MPADQPSDSHLTTLRVIAQAGLTVAVAAEALRTAPRRIGSR